MYDFYLTDNAVKLLISFHGYRYSTSDKLLAATFRRHFSTGRYSVQSFSSRTLVACTRMNQPFLEVDEHKICQLLLLPSNSARTELINYWWKASLPPVDLGANLLQN